jgi:hypothetical protein
MMENSQIKQVKQIQQKTSFSFKLPGKINQQMNEAIVAEGRGLRGKSKWIIEAIESFLSLENFPELTSLSEGVEKNPTAITIRIPSALMLRLENAIVIIRKNHPALEGVKSKIVRASIYQRILGNFKHSGDRNRP